MLLSNGSDPNICVAAEGVPLVSPLVVASAYGHGGVVDELLRSGARVDLACGDSAMGVAVANGRVEVVKRLIAAGAGVAEPNDGGWTYLMHAAIAAQEDVIPLLVAAGCPLEATRRRVPEAIDDTDGQTALMMAAAWDPRPVRALIRAGANVHARDAAGATPLIHAVKGAIRTAEHGETTPGKWHASIVAMLLEAGADPDATGLSGQTAFDLAAQAGPNAAVIRTMLAAPHLHRPLTVAPAILPSRSNFPTTE